MKNKMTLFLTNSNHFSIARMEVWKWHLIKNVSSFNVNIKSFLYETKMKPQKVFREHNR